MKGKTGVSRCIVGKEKKSEKLDRIYYSGISLIMGKNPEIASETVSQALGREFETRRPLRFQKSKSVRCPRVSPPSENLRKQEKHFGCKLRVNLAKAFVFPTVFAKSYAELLVVS
jgi:hypothetical protein